MTNRDAVEFLRHEHEVAKAKFAEIEQAPASMRGELWRRLQPELKVHEVVEDTYLYGPLAQDPRAAGSPVAGFEDRQDADVQQVESLMAEADALDPASDAWLAKVLAVRDALAQHIAVEESEILPEIPGIWSADELQAAGAQMAAAKLRQLGAVAG